MKEPLKIGLFTGGFSAEREVALRSAQLIEKYLDAGKYKLYKIDVEEEAWLFEGKYPFDLTNAVLSLPDEEIRFDVACVIIHGSPAENGWIQGYFDMKGIPYTCSSPFSSALTFDKQATKNYLRSFQVPMANSLLVKKSEVVDQVKVEALELPLFIKPNKQGSSFGVSKVNALEDLDEAIEKAFEYDAEVIIESFIKGREFSCGVICLDGKPQALPITEIKPFHEFFDYAGKYEKQSEEITPAQIPDELTKQCQSRSLQIFELLQCKGMARFDYILDRGIFYFLEANTIPGLSETSIVPQQVEAAGYGLDKFVEDLILNCLKGNRTSAFQKNG